MSHGNEVASSSVESVRFSFMTDEEVKKHSLVKITNPNLLDSVERPIPGGLYDPALGSLDENTPCKTCGQRSIHCPGHCGHIDLVSPVYNPLLFDLLYVILSRTCFLCFHFRDKQNDVEKIVTQLKMIAKGDITGAKQFAEAENIEFILSEDSDGSNVTNSWSQDRESENHKQQNLTSLQFSEARSVLIKFLKPRSSKCKNCEKKNPKITKPTFGWLHMKGLSGAYSRSNIIRSTNLERPGDDDDSDGHDDEDDRISSEVDNSNSSSKRKAIRGKKAVSAREENDKQKTKFSGPLLPSEVRDVLKLLWENEAEMCSYLCNFQTDGLSSSEKMSGYSMFFISAILVPPIKFRPASRGQDSVMEHAHTVLLGKLLQANIGLGNAHINDSERSKIVNRWMDLQLSINVLFDSKTATGRDAATGICQILEKKEGIFRQKMMGKRVNYACRSVISPDPYLAVNEIGIPPYFALRLTYPERVTPWNVSKLREAIINGPEVHPGATNYSDRVSVVKLPANKKARISVSRKLPSSRGNAAEFGKNFEHNFEGKIVYRHLQDGDVVLVNRQPTLHKPSIMAHVVRVLKGEKTLRMHYANCSSYNADFDGDEMNVHFPQDEVSRAEAYNIVNANNQYIVPTRGDTVRGLIQDHIVSAVLLTMKDTFLTKDIFDHLVFSSGIFNLGPRPSSNLNSKFSILDSNGALPPILPAMWRPKPLWTGKQVITAVLNHITRGSIPFTVENEGKIPYNYFSGDSKKARKIEAHNSENLLLIHKNELVHGVIDKAQFGKYGLVHTVQELYGPNCAGILLSALSRLFTHFLQLHGFTCGVDDLIVLPKYDKRREDELEGEDVGESVHCDFVGHKDREKLGSDELQTKIEKAICLNGQAATARLDTLMKNKLRDKGSKINQELLLKGLVKPFPKNCISLMTISGAKGSSVNFQQISSSLGQQELEGKRVPRMVSGKTLPCFPPWDFSSRAGGFISDRFLTGLRPQEYYFHCMAGREGLVDTAVKTSRSGYLQRCLVKNLECLTVSYDYTVRDADGSIVQFCYGEDGVDVHQTSFLNKFKALQINKDIIQDKFQEQLEFNSYIRDLPEGYRQKGEKFINELIKRGKNLGKEKKVKKEFLMLMTQKYLSSLVHAGEAVGVIAAQSVGEPSTQMTLNTFHLAGRGEMNVTLGIPRLQEILMTASNDIKTPIMTCPLLEGTSSNETEVLIEKVKKIAVADLIESITVNVSPVTVEYLKISRIYKLRMKFKKHNQVSRKEAIEALEVYFLRALEDSIFSHFQLLSKISGIKNFEQQSRDSGENDDADVADDSGTNKSKENINEDEEEDIDEGGDDIGSDAQKRKKQSADEMDYEDGDEVVNESEPSIRQDEEKSDDDDDDVDNENVEENKSTIAKVKERTKAIFIRKKDDKSIYSKAKHTQYDVHFKFENEPHILLAQIAQKAAQKVYFNRTGKIDQCRIVEYDVSERDVIWEEKTKEKTKNPKPSYALKAAGTSLASFWDMDDLLKLNNVYSNNIYVMLNTYGVEAARATIIREIRNVFKIYGVEIDPRHLTLIADYMTQNGGYRGMSRHGCISESVSPFIKMSFETASKFIVEAASKCMVDHLETPSARVILGLPVKVGTGSFDLMQKLDS